MVPTDKIANFFRDFPRKSAHFPNKTVGVSGRCHVTDYWSATLFSLFLLTWPSRSIEHVKASRLSYMLQSFFPRIDLRFAIGPD